MTDTWWQLTYGFKISYVTSVARHANNAGFRGCFARMRLTLGQIAQNRHRVAHVGLEFVCGYGTRASGQCAER